MKQYHELRYGLIILILFTLLGVIPVWSAPNLISYQGMLKDSDGDPVSGLVDMSFAVYDVKTGGGALWSEEHIGVEVDDGIYYVLLGDGILTSGSFDSGLFSGDNRWLEVTGGAEVPAPRIRITSNAFSLNAQDADTVDGVHASALEESAEIDADIAAHRRKASAHHTKYTHGNAVTAMGAKDDANPLHHDKTAGFSELVDTAVDSQIPDDITINQAANADTLDDVHASYFATSGHNHDGVYEKKYNNVIVVSKDGRGDYTNPIAALNSITDNGVNAPYLVKIMPGVYDVGSRSVKMKPYVDIEGSGENVTRITGNVNSNASGVVMGASDAELRLLTVQNIGGGTYAVAIYNNGASPKLTRVTAIATGGANNFSVYNISSSSIMTQVIATASGGKNANYGVCNYSSSPTMTQVTATASGKGNNNYGVYNYYSSPTMTQVTVTASGKANNNYGVHNYGGGPIKIDHSVITGQTATIYNVLSPAYVCNTRLEGGAVAGGGTTCAGVYDEDYIFYPDTCP